ncbi:type I glyceraldehyde-3-phosphate dehydrogenase, partial [Patescibacteria group bacterium]|nr:type I glyceraldehyde-3-phosphate dehydrogenase [Patescibacteria group bacterium]
YIVDTNCDKDFRRDRAGAINIVPTSSGASEALEAVVPKIAGKTNAMAMRIPVAVGSIIDFTFVSSRQTSVEEVNGIIKEYASREKWKDILEASEEELVSSDIIKNPHGCIVDLALTKVANGNLVKIMAWYDNEWGYVNMLLKHVVEVAKLL